MYIAFDPGETTGYAIFDAHGKISDFGQIPNGVEGLTGFLMEHDEPVTAVIIESYMVRPDDHSLKANVGSKMETVQAIGTIRGWAYARKAEIIMQQPQVKKIGELNSGYKPGSNHSQSHQIDAINHGVYYLVKKGIRKPTGLEGYDMV